LSLFRKKIKKMSSTGGNKRVGSCNVYEQQKLENVERNKRRLPVLNIPTIVGSMASQGQPKKTSKVREKTVVVKFMSFACRKIIE
jgi:hypothetical protein